MQEVSTAVGVDVSVRNLSHPSDMAALAELISSNKQLRSLNLTGNGFGADGAVYLSEILRMCPTLHCLILGNNNLRAGVEKFADALWESQLEELSLTANALGARACQIASTAAPSTLISLDLSHNAFGPVGGAAVAKMLAANTSLRSLDLSLCGIARSGATSVAGALSGNTASVLRELNLQKNFIGPDGAEAVAAMLSTNRTLATLNLSDNRILEGQDTKGVTALAKALFENTTIVGLNLEYNDINGAGKAALLEAKQRSDHRRAVPLDLRF